MSGSILYLSQTLLKMEEAAFIPNIESPAGTSLLE